MSQTGRSSAPWLALAVLALGLFMTLVDLTIVNVAIPSIVDQLHASAHAVFTQAFVDAMRPTMALVIAIILVAAAGALAARNRPSRSDAVAVGAAEAAEVA